MICDQCETVAHCTKHGCVPKQPMLTKDEALKLALAALFSYEDEYVDDGIGGITSSFCYDKDAVNKAITAIKQALAAPVQEPVAYMDKYGEIYKDVENVLSTDIPLYTTPPAAPVQNSDHEFKNFHRVLCERFGYTHDEVDWKRDQVSLIEWIAKQVNPAAPVREPYAWHYKNAGGVSAWHFGPSRRFDADLDASERWPKTHQLIPVYTTPPAAQRQWVGLTDEEAEELRIEKEFDKWGISESAFKYAVRDIEAELKERNK